MPSDVRPKASSCEVGFFFSLPLLFHLPQLQRVSISNRMEGCRTRELNEAKMGDGRQKRH